MKVRFFLNSDANHEATNIGEWVDTVDDLELAEGEWESFTDDQKHSAARDYWLENGLPEIYYEEQ